MARLLFILGREPRSTKVNKQSMVSKRSDSRHRRKPSSVSSIKRFHLYLGNFDEQSEHEHTETKTRLGRVIDVVVRMRKNLSEEKLKLIKFQSWEE